ncbi:hypothetical protein GAMM_30089 [Gammaproteobacteria bacterium]
MNTPSKQISDTNQTQLMNAALANDTSTVKKLLLDGICNGTLSQKDIDKLPPKFCEPAANLALISNIKDLLLLENLELRKLIVDKYPTGWKAQADTSKLWWQDKAFRERPDAEIIEFAINKLNSALGQGDFANTKHYCSILKLNLNDSETNSLIPKLAAQAKLISDQ